MIAVFQFAMALLASAGPQGGQASQSSLIEAFAAYCLQEGPADGLAKAMAAANAQAVPVDPSRGWPEIAAWQLGAVRVSNISSSRSRDAWRCAVRANIGRLDADDVLLTEVANKIGGDFRDGNPGRRHSDWIIPSEKWFVRVSIDRPVESDVTISLTAEAMAR